MANLRRSVIRALSFSAVVLVALRIWQAVQDMQGGEVTGILALPLTVILPLAAFAFMARQRDLISQEGALMQLGVLVHVLLIIAMPSFALHLALGFPVVFLVVELFDTRAPAAVRQWIKARVLA